MCVGRRQFIICNKRICYNDYKCIELQQGIYLNYHKDLYVKQLGEYTSNVVIGEAFSIDSNYPVCQSDECCIEDQMKKWGGRFVVFSNGKIYPDATNSLGIFYKRYKDSVIISSSIYLMNKYICESGGCLPQISDYELDYRFGNIALWDYYPGPYTPYEGVFRLMQYEYIDLLNDNYISSRSCKWNPIYKSMSPEQLTDLFIQYTSFMLKEINKKYDGIYVPLTGGLDSRCVCSLCKASNIKFSTYTEERSYKTHGIVFLGFEHRVPREISKRLNVKWKYCKIENWNQDRWNNILKHSMGMVRNCNLYSFAYNQYPQGNSNNIILHGSIFEISREYMSKRFLDDVEDVEEKKGVYLDYFQKDMERSLVHRKSLLAWLESYINRAGNDMIMSDTFYYEQRMGSWLSDLNQAMDIIDFNRISLINNYELISILMAYPRDMRIKEEHQKMIINKSTPIISDIPINYMNIFDLIKMYKIYGYRRLMLMLNKILRKKNES